MVCMIGECVIHTRMYNRCRCTVGSTYTYPMLRMVLLFVHACMVAVCTVSSLRLFELNTGNSRSTLDTGQYRLVLVCIRCPACMQFI